MFEHEVNSLFNISCAEIEISLRIQGFVIWWLYPFDGVEMSNLYLKKNSNYGESHSSGMVDVGFDLNTREANVNRGKYGRRGKIGEWCKNLGQFLSKK